MIKLIWTTIFLILTGFAPKSFNGTVISVTDGDTIVVLMADKTSVKIRLEGIDCPEGKQDFGTRAKQATSQLCYGKKVRVEKLGEDRYGRTLARVYVGNLCVNKELLRLGMAWHYKKYNKHAKMAKLENKARAAKIGLWAMDNAVAPWEFRRVKK
jgi:endonuclease YncB( thermonuclease family)